MNALTFPAQAAPTTQVGNTTLNIGIFLVFVLVTLGIVIRVSKQKIGRAHV